MLKFLLLDIQIKSPCCAETMKAGRLLKCMGSMVGILLLRFLALTCQQMNVNKNMVVQPFGKPAVMSLTT